MRMLWALSSRLGFSFEVTNTEELVWGNLVDGKWNGKVGCAAYGDCDLIIGAIFISSPRLKVLSSTLPFDYDGLSFAAPYPTSPKGGAATVSTLLSPLSPAVWAAVLASLVVATSALLAVAKTEERIGANKTLRTWSEPSEAAWYTFGTVLGESITRDKMSDKAWALRWAGGSHLLVHTSHTTVHCTSRRNVPSPTGSCCPSGCCSAWSSPPVTGAACARSS